MVVLRALNGGSSNGPRPRMLTLESHLLRALAVAGCAPSFFNGARYCVAPSRRAFSAALDGVVCERCRPAGAARLALETMALLGALPDCRWSDRRQVPDHVAREVSGLTSAFAAWHLDRKPRSLAHVER
jgi:DNA repair protein RecO (recombination protein O)